MEDLKRLTINLASPFSNSVQKSSRSFDRSELVGLGIVAAMSTTTTSTTPTDHETSPSSLSKISHRVLADKVLSVAMTKPVMIGGSKSIPIQSSAGAGTALGLGFGFGGERLRVVGGGVEDGMMEMEMEMEMSEGYTCVVSQIGNDRVTKREYFDDRLLSADLKSAHVVTGGVFSRSCLVEVEEMPFWGGLDFLSSCFLCGKDLRGIDIFMYRGEKAFCSVECRDVQIATDKLKEKRGRVRVRSMEHSESPCCSPMLSYTGVVAA